jgi:hypothetical protein
MGGFHIWITAMEKCTYTGEPSLQEGRRWFVSTGCTPSDVVRTAFKAVATWAEHETREEFKFKGVRVFSPHLELNNLVARGAGKSPGSNSFEEAPDKPPTSVSASQKSGQPCSV